VPFVFNFNPYRAKIQPQLYVKHSIFNGSAPQHDNDVKIEHSISGNMNTVIPTTKVKVKCTLVQALRLCTGRAARSGSRGIALLFLDHGTRRGWGFSVTSRPLFAPGRDLVPIAQQAGWASGPVWTGAENLTPLGFDPRTVQPVASRYTDYATRPAILTTAHVLLSPYCDFSGNNMLSHITKIHNDRPCQRKRNFRCFISYRYCLKDKTENEYPEATGSNIA